MKYLKCIKELEFCANIILYPTHFIYNDIIIKIKVNKYVKTLFCYLQSTFTLLGIEFMFYFIVLFAMNINAL